MKPFAFPKQHRILKRSEFIDFYNHGAAVHSSGFVLVYKHGLSGISRIGITVSRKVGNSVIRNRIKRLVREFYRTHYSELSDQWDYHIIAKKPASLYSSRESFASLTQLVNKFNGTVKSSK